jgi:hypothetical protein
MAKARVTITGVKEMKARLRQVARQFPDLVARALYLEAQIELTESKRRVPVDTGTLRASGQVIGPDRGAGRKLFVTIAYGGAAESYAIYVHEDLEAFHRIGQAKYLESVLLESAPYMADRLARRVQLDKLKV